MRRKFMLPARFSYWCNATFILFNFVPEDKTPSPKLLLQAAEKDSYASLRSIVSLQRSG
jgi:hypothetical protein